MVAAYLNLFLFCYQLVQLLCPGPEIEVSCVERFPSGYTTQQTAIAKKSITGIPDIHNLSFITHYNGSINYILG
jgi:hypothetical protein